MLSTLGTVQNFPSSGHEGVRLEGEEDITVDERRTERKEQMNQPRGKPRGIQAKGWFFYDASVAVCDR